MADPRVVIVGGGFGGLKAARALRRAKVAVTLIDRRNHHLFQPLLYQVATAMLNPSDIAVALRRIVRGQKNCMVVLGEAERIDLAQKQVVLRDGVVPYDFLIVATGATHSYFGHDEWEAVAPGLKTIEDALEIRRRMLLAYESAERTDDPAARERLLTFVVVGGGPTGVEMAGAMAEIARHVLTRDFRRIDPSSAKIILAEAGPRLLTAFAPHLGDAAAKRLEKMGVQVRVNCAVSGIDKGGVTLASGERIAASTVVWGAGVAASPLARTLGVPLDRAGRVLVEPDLSVPGAPEVFVIGDLAAVKAPDGKPVPGVAQGAIQGGAHAARGIERTLRGLPRRPFRYRDKGSLATIGRAAAVAEIGRLRTVGFFAWVVWLLVHVLSLIGFRNRLSVLAEWAWVYVTYERGAMLITGEIHELQREHGALPAAAASPSESSCAAPSSAESSPSSAPAKTEGRGSS
jgi:NADH dehydrogenase